MKKKIIKWIAFLMACITTITSIFFLEPAYGASYNIKQSKQIKEISEFPQSYQAGLKNIQSIYPNAKFIYFDTGLDWYKDVLTSDNELRFGRNLIYSSCPSSWKSTSPQAYNAATSTFTQVEPGWNQASQAAIEYYMDPRNFFTEKEIFQFMQLTYSDAQTVEGTQSILAGTYLGRESIKDNDGNTITYAEALVKIGKTVGVSPYLLASRVRQENGGGKSALVSGSSGYYNFFNIGAYGSTTSAIISRGLNTAKSRGWNTKYKSLLGGAEVLRDNYVNAGKDCLYLHHWNVVASNGVVSYMPYMTNMLAPVDETKTLAKSITDKNAAYTFVIPVYKNMPSVTTLSNQTGNSNFLLKELLLNDGQISIGTFSSYNYEYYASSSDSYVLLKATMYESTSNMKINGMDMTATNNAVEKAIILNPGSNKVEILITAENGLSREYVLNIVKDDGTPYYDSANYELVGSEVVVEQNVSVDSLRSKFQLLNCSLSVFNSEGKEKGPEEICISDDYVSIRNNNGEVIYHSTILLEGDVNKDGIVNGDDLNKTIEFVLGITTMNSSEFRSADLNKDDNIDATDIGMLKNKIGGVDAYNHNVVLSVNKTDLYVGKEIPVSITAPYGSYIVEGYLTYNEGQVEATDVSNTGKIKFIADGSRVIFENNKNEVLFRPVTQGGSVLYDIEIIKTYDILSKNAIEVSATNAYLNVNRAQLNVSINPNENVVEGKNSSVMNLIIENKTTEEIKNVLIELGNKVEFENGTKNAIFGSLMPGERKELTLFAESNLIYGRYNSTIGISYIDDVEIESKLTYPISFQLLKHKHKTYEITEEFHDACCEICGEGGKESHSYYRVSENNYKCVDCKYEKKYAISIKQTGKVVGSAILIEPTVVENESPMSLNDAIVEWYIEGQKITNKSNLLLTFNSIGNREVNCVIKTKDGIVVTTTCVITIIQKPSDGFIIAATCNSITVPKSLKYEYKISNGNWTEGKTFDNLLPGAEYVLYRRDKNNHKNIDSIKIHIEHCVKQYTEKNNVCEKDIQMNGICSFCSDSVVKLLSDTAHGHVYGQYEVLSTGTCKTEAKEIATCAYCYKTTIKKQENCREHLFIKYHANNDAICNIGGTATSTCEYGCGATNIINTSNETSGHKYTYVEKDAATVEHCATEIAYCEYCGQINERIIDGTKIKTITRTKIKLSSVKTNQSGLPEIVIENDDLILYDFIWKNSSGLEVTDQSHDIILRYDEVYSLSSLTLKVKPGYAIDTNTKIYINGYEYTGNAEIKDDLITFKNVGQFAF